MRIPLRQYWQLLVDFLRPQWQRAAWLAALLLVSIGLQLVNPQIMRDFIDVVYWPGRHWHTFNVADAMLCIAVFLLILATFVTDSSGQTRGPQRK